MDKENITELYDLLDFTDAKKLIILENLVSSQVSLYDSIDVSEDVYKDTGIDRWCQTLPTLEGSKHLIHKMIRCPANDLQLLLQRQKSYFKTPIDFSILKEYENDALWIYKLNNEVKENNFINVLFPSTFSFLNYIEPLLEFYHMYKIYLIPLNVIIYPILSLFAPLYYLNKYLMFNITITSYIQILFKILKMLFTFTGDIKTTLIKIISVCTYIFLFAYNVYQTAEYSYMLYKIKDTLYKKIFNLSMFLKEASQILTVDVPNASELLIPFIKLKEHTSLNITGINADFPSIYRIWKDNSIKDAISNVLLKIYSLDVLNSISCLKGFCKIDYSQDGESKLWNMRNPLLSSGQTANPVDLSRNIVITGPNAAGKTTYVKSILSNIILAQTFGIAYAQKGTINIYDSIISFMRISDVLGTKSYFEAEAEYCLKMMKKAKELCDNNKRGLFLMDEPMHSTPPTEGMATAYAVAEYIGNLSGSTVILTTHFHKLVQLEDRYPEKFINLSVEAIPLPNRAFKFPYAIRKGYSYQCIAIELLCSKEFPEEVIESAINMKNKIYDEISSR